MQSSVLNPKLNVNLKYMLILSGWSLTEVQLDEAEKNFEDYHSYINLILWKRSQALLSRAQSIEEQFWKQKLVCRWLQEGERNTKYFHNMVKKRRQKSMIYVIEGVNGGLTDNKEIKESVVKYFEELFTGGDCDLSNLDLSHIFLLVTDKENRRLCLPYHGEDKKYYFQ